MLTTCPECHTTFRVGQPHLAARQGMVRCGNCAAVFNAYDTLLPEFETPPGENTGPAESETWSADGSDRSSIEQPSHVSEERTPEFAPDASWEESGLAGASPDEFHEEFSAPPEVSDDGSEPGDGWEQPGLPSDEPGDWPEEYEAGQEEDVVTIGEASEPQVAPSSTVEESTDEILLSELPNRRKAVSSRVVWKRLGYGVLSLLLALLFLGQLVYFLRGEIVSRQPEWRTGLEGACEVVGCRIPLARDLKLLRIESSSLETDPEQPAHARLRISLVNRSNAEQTWPHLILKLTDAKNAPLAQKAFSPAEYRPKDGKPAYGVRPMSEQELTVDLDLAAIEAAGYEVRLHYP